MRSLLLILFALAISFAGYSQYDSTRVRQHNSAYGFDFKNLKAINTLIIPNDTPKLAMKDSGAIASLSGRLFSWNGKNWAGMLPGRLKGNVLSIEDKNITYEIKGDEDTIYVNETGVFMEFPNPVLFPGKIITIGSSILQSSGEVGFLGSYLPVMYVFPGASNSVYSQMLAQNTTYTSDGSQWVATRSSHLTRVTTSPWALGEGLVSEINYENKGLVTYYLKGIKAGDGVTVTKDGNYDILISATGSGDVTLPQVDSAVNTAKAVSVKYADTTAMLSPYLKKIDTTGKWKPLSYVPAWSEITGKPTLLSRSDFSAAAPLSYNSGTGQYSITKANGSTDGYLSKEDWNLFNNKVSSPWVKSGNDISYSGGTVSVNSSGVNSNLIQFNISDDRAKAFSILDNSVDNRGVIASNSRIGTTGNRLFFNWVLGNYNGNDASQGWISQTVIEKNAGNSITFDKFSGWKWTYWDGNGYYTPFVISSSKRVGINTSNPLEALHVSGKIKVDTIPTGAVTDSFLVAKSGVINKVSSSLFAQQQSLTDSIQILRDSIAKLKAGKLDTGYNYTINLSRPLKFTNDSLRVDLVSDTGAGVLGKNYVTATNDTLATKQYVRDNAGGGGSFPDLSSRNYANDSLAVTVGKLKLWDWYRTGNVVKIVTELPMYQTVNPAFFVEVTNETSDTFSVKMADFGTPFNYDIVWGDGDTTKGKTSSTGGSDPGGHRYTGTGTYQIQLIPSSFPAVREIFVRSGGVGVQGRLKSIKNLETLGNSYRTLGLFSFDLKGVLDTLNYKSTIYTVIVEYSDVTSTKLNYPPNMQALRYRFNNKLSTFEGTLPATTFDLSFYNCDLSNASIEELLQWLDGQTFNAGAKTLDIRQGKAWSPVGNTTTYISNLEGKGFTITHD